MRSIPVVVFLALAAPLANAQCVADSSATQTHVVELFTSEGCSSCPPADRWLAALPSSENLLPLAFHVDYWDSSSWTDRFADPRYTKRQRALAAQSNSTVVYTPEVALDGHELRDWSDARLPTGEVAPLKLALTVQPGSTVRAHLDATGAADADGTYEAFFAITENGLSSQVRGGENRGERLRHEHVVRAFSGPLPLDRADASLLMPADLDPSRAQVAAFVQRRDNGAIVDAVQVALTQCAGASSG